MICGQCGHSVSALFSNGNCIECNSGGEKLVPFTKPTKKRDIFKEAFATLVTASVIAKERKDHQRAAREHIAKEHVKRKYGRPIRRRKGFEK